MWPMPMPGTQRDYRGERLDAARLSREADAITKVPSDQDRFAADQAIRLAEIKAGKKPPGQEANERIDARERQEREFRAQQQQIQHERQMDQERLRMQQSMNSARVDAMKRNGGVNGSGIAADVPFFRETRPSGTNHWVSNAAAAGGGVPTGGGMPTGGASPPSAPVAAVPAFQGSAHLTSTARAPVLGAGGGLFAGMQGFSGGMANLANQAVANKLAQANFKNSLSAYNADLEGNRASREWFDSDTRRRASDSDITSARYRDIGTIAGMFD